MKEGRLSDAIQAQNDAEIWDREIHDNQIDHFANLLSSAAAQRGKKDSMSSLHRPGRSSFVSRTSIFNQSRVLQPCVPCNAEIGTMKEDQVSAYNPDEENDIAPNIIVT